MKMPHVRNVPQYIRALPDLFEPAPRGDDSWHEATIPHQEMRKLDWEVWSTSTAACLGGAVLKMVDEAPDVANSLLVVSGGVFAGWVIDRATRTD